eukprot:g61575.t1
MVLIDTSLSMSLSSLFLEKMWTLPSSASKGYKNNCASAMAQEADPSSLQQPLFPETCGLFYTTAVSLNPVESPPHFDPGFLYVALLPTSQQTPSQIIFFSDKKYMTEKQYERKSWFEVFIKLYI